MKSQVFVLGVLFLVRVASAAGVLNLVNCPDCGNEVSVRAVFCPKCGCSREAIQQHVRAIETASRCSEADAQKLLGPVLLGQVGRVRFFRERDCVMNVLTNQVVALAFYPPTARKAAETARQKTLAILDMGFTLSQIFTLRRDLVNEMLGPRLKEVSH